MEVTLIEKIDDELSKDFATSITNFSTYSKQNDKVIVAKKREYFKYQKAYQLLQYLVQKPDEISQQTRLKLLHYVSCAHPSEFSIPVQILFTEI